MSTVSARIITTLRGPLAVLDNGSGAPPVLLVPGFTGSKEDFAPLLDPLAQAGFRVVAVDQRGQFESPGADDPAAYTVAALAEDLLAIDAEIAGAGMPDVFISAGAHCTQSRAASGSLSSRAPVGWCSG